VKFLALILPIILILAACSSIEKKAETAAPAEVKPALPQSLEEAVKSPYRTEANRARDPYRHPLETLTFFGMTPDMTVVEITPSAGWYTEILAPFLAEKGHYIAAVNKVPNAEHDQQNQKLSAWLSTHPDAGSKVTFTTFMPPKEVDIAPPGTADLVLTFRNVHNWSSKHNEKAAFSAFFKALKPGGILGVVEHRANASKHADGKSGYVREKEVISYAKRAGFKLVDRSEINANPKDTKDYPKGVWALPPSLQGDAQEREKYLAIGESDRMTLKFQKPKK